MPFPLLMNRSSLLVAASFALLAACTPTTPGTSDSSASSAGTAASASSVVETRNVSYRGTVENQGVSIFMEGTHKLELDDGRFILLQSDVVDLNASVGMKVEVLGAVRPTVEQGGQIMRVERVTSLEMPSSSSSVTKIISRLFCG